MCILFIRVEDNPGPGGYQLILANNRDEHYTRPTKPAGRWGQNDRCISGLDQEPGREGGTWMGVSESGKIASLLNILYKDNSRCKKGRGFLVVDYLNSSASGEEFTNEMARERHEYNPFNLVILEKNCRKWKLNYFSSNDESSPFDLSTEDVHAFGNSAMKVPWKKVTDGKAVFSQITKNYCSTNDKAKLTNALMDLLNDPTPHLPDAQLESQAEGYLDRDVTIQRSGIYVESPQIEYGTRTNTLILIDANGNGEYIERTMREPIDAYHPVWDTTKVDFSFKSTA